MRSFFVLRGDLLLHHSPLRSDVYCLPHYPRAHSQEALVLMVNWAWYLSATAPSCSEPTPTSWLSRARCSSLMGGSLISCDPSQASSPQLHRFIMTWPPPAASKQHCPLQNITSAISVWIHTGGLCLWVWDGEQERVKRQRRRRALNLAAVTCTQ